MKSNRQLSLSSKLRNNVRQGRLMPALVTDVFYDRATVKLGVNGSGARMENLLIVGGPIEAGDLVFVDSTTPEPTVVAKGTKGITQGDLDAALKGLANQESLSNFRIKICLYRGGSSIAMYDPSVSGLNEAIGAASDGDVIYLPDIRIASDITVPDEVTLKGVSSRESIIFGTVTLGENSTLENLKVVVTGQFDDSKAIIITAVETQAMIKNCEIHSYQCAADNSIAIEMQADSMLDLSYSLVVGYSYEGLGYAITFNTGSMVNATHSRLWATTEWYTGTGAIEEYSITEGLEESEIWCGPSASTLYPYGSRGSTIYNAAKVASAFLIAEDVTVPGTASQNIFFLEAQRADNYLYYKWNVTAGQGWIREISPIDGSEITLQVPNYSQSFGEFVVIGDRKVIATSRNHATVTSASTFYIYLLDFEASSVTLEHSFNRVQQEGDEYEGAFSGQAEEYLHYHMYHKPFVTTKANGDIIVSIIGRYTLSTRHEYVGSIPTSPTLLPPAQKNGIYFLSKNFTEGSGWTYHRGVYFPGSHDHWSELVNNQSSYSQENFQYIYAIGRKIVVPVDVTSIYTVPPGTVSYGTNEHFLYFLDPDGNEVVWDYPSSTTTDYIVEDNVYIGAFVYDIVTGEIDFIYDIQLETGDWGEGLDPYSFGVDHEGDNLFISSSPTHPETTDYIERIWRFDLEDMTVGIHYTAPDDNNYFTFVWNNSHCYLVNYGAGTTVVIVEVEGMAVVNTAYDNTDELITNIPDPVLDDNNNFLWVVDVANDLIVGVNLEDGSTISFDASFSMTAYTSMSVICFGNFFILRGYNNGTFSYNYFIVRSS